MGQNKGVSASPTGLSSFGSDPQAVPPVPASIPNARRAFWAGVACPTCLARPGDWCRTKSGKLAEITHATRIAGAKG